MATPSAASIAPAAQSAIVDVFGSGGLVGLALLAMLMFAGILGYLLIKQAQHLSKILEATSATETARQAVISELARHAQASHAQAVANGGKMDTIIAFIGGIKS
jgi:hypothetical protein